MTPLCVLIVLVLTWLASGQLQCPYLPASFGDEVGQLDLANSITVLLRRYDVGEEIGEQSLGIIYLCTSVCIHLHA